LKVLKQKALTSWLKRNSDEMREISNRNNTDIQDQGMNTAETEHNTISLYSMAKYYINLGPLVKQGKPLSPSKHVNLITDGI
jgi:hypothetical protein